jgi:release factor glutamine methyltransferase
MLAWATALLESSSVESPRLDAECLLASLLGTDRLHLYAAAEERVSPPAFEAYRALLSRRRAREPLAYLTGTKEFWSLAFGVTPDVLIPRPETETLVETALARLSKFRGPVIADIGTGSGAIAVAVAKAVPHSRLYATEVSSGALDVARANAARHGVSERITFLHGDLVEPLLRLGLARHCDLMVSNPPYVATGELPGLPPEVCYEPLEALDGGPDGLDVHRRLISGASAVLKPGGWLALEMAPGQGPSLARLLHKQDLFDDIEVTTDLSGQERVIVARCTGPGPVRSGVRFGLRERAGRPHGR